MKCENDLEWLKARFELMGYPCEEAWQKIYAVCGHVMGQYPCLDSEYQEPEISGVFEFEG